MRHHRTYRGKVVSIVLHNGKVIIDKFVETPKHNQFMVLEEYGRVQMSSIKSFFIYRLPKR